MSEVAALWCAVFISMGRESYSNVCSGSAAHEFWEIEMEVNMYEIAVSSKASGLRIATYWLELNRQGGEAGSPRGVSGRLTLDAGSRKPSSDAKTCLTVEGEEWIAMRQATAYVEVHHPGAAIESMPVDAED